MCSSVKPPSPNDHLQKLAVSWMGLDHCNGPFQNKANIPRWRNEARSVVWAVHPRKIQDDNRKPILSFATSTCCIPPDGKASLAPHCCHNRRQVLLLAVAHRHCLVNQISLVSSHTRCLCGHIEGWLEHAYHQATEFLSKSLLH